MYIIIITLSVGIIWVAYEIWRAPVYDDDFKQIRPAKKLKDIFK